MGNDRLDVKSKSRLHGAGDRLGFGKMGLLIVYLCLAIGVSFICSVLEAVILSVTPSYIARLKQKGQRGVRLLESLKENIDEPLSAILSLNTIAHTVGAAGVGAQAQVVFGKASVSIVSGVLTLLILVLSEIIPKTLGATHWRLLAIPSAYVLRVMDWVLKPLVYFSLFITKSISGERRISSVSLEEIHALAELAEQESLIEEDELEIFRNLVFFRKIQISRIRTPRTVVFSLPEDETLRELMDSDPKLSYSRIPIYGKSRDDITGYILKDVILAEAANGNLDVPLSSFRREIVVIPDFLYLNVLLQKFIKNHEQFAMTVDEYGDFTGVVTMEDLVETLIGQEIVDEMDEHADMQAFARRSGAMLSYLADRRHRGYGWRASNSDPESH